jgi:UDP-GlcNAc:undecaprenyl-phosphate/decaprenyl-phosphate GlcNAc-1-phosphate transferase
MFHLLAILVSSYITFRALPIIIKVAREKRLIDSPGVRKVHNEPVPSLGGIGIFVGFLLTGCLFWPGAQVVNAYELASVVSACLVIFFLGVKDDTVGVGPANKFLMQVFAAGIVVFKHGLIIFSFYSLFGLYTVPSALTVTTTCLTIILIINAYNLIDGIDGLSALLGFFSMSVFGAYFFITGEPGFSILAASMIGSLAAFYYYNRYPAKVFMGDTGSLLLGLVNAIFALKFMVIAADSGNGILVAANGPILSMAILFVPLFDAMRVFSSRILRGRSPFTAEKNHIHHILITKGFTHNQIGLHLLVFNAFLVLLMWVLKDVLSSTQLFFLMVAVGSVATWTAYRLPDCISAPQATHISPLRPVAAVGNVTNVIRDQKPEPVVANTRALQ